MKRKPIGKAVKVEKGWGFELIFANNDKYCGKILVFNEGGECSFHYHLKKHETWLITKGSFILKRIDLQTGLPYKTTLNVGDVVELKEGVPHKLRAPLGGELFEVSTPHYDEDSYRIAPGDSQKKEKKQMEFSFTNNTKNIQPEETKYYSAE